MKQFRVSFRVFFPGQSNIINHWQDMPLRDIPKWLNTYQFTHPNVESISVKVWFHDGEGEQDET